jgi:hypothetical protein
MLNSILNINFFMHIKKHLSFDALISDISTRIKNILDHRRVASTSYTIHDTMMSAFACMYMQSPSLLSFQRLMERRTNRNNIQNMFSVSETPKDTALKELIDEISPQELLPLFKTYTSKLQRNHFLKEYQFINDKYLVALDGTEYYSSKKVNCNCCLEKKAKNGVITYSHQALQASIVSPNKKQIIPLMPEDISNTDGETKQDCETNAAKRFVPKLRSEHPRMPMIWLADSLYAKEPFIKVIKSKEDDNFIFRAKEGDHKKLYEHIDSREATKHHLTNSKGNETLYYHWYNDVPLNAAGNLSVNVLRVYSTKTDRSGNKKSTIIGVWITDIEITEVSVVDITRAARSRWMIENECFNILKNQGAAIDHCYGHGKKNLAFNFYILIMLAFTLHQIHELTEKIFQQARTAYVVKKEFWNGILWLFNMMLFNDWYQMMEFAVKQRNPDFEGLRPT